MRLSPLALGFALLPAAAQAGAGLEFTPGDIIGWEAHSFEGETRYDLVEISGREAIHASCTDNTASGLFYREKIDLTETPVVEWQWRVKETFSGHDETTRAGDDYAARLYVVDEHRVLRWRTRAVNYVWASEQERSSDWANAYASQARMVAMRSGDDVGPEWRTERRNIREDFRHYHDRDITEIDAIAIMTDCDDTGEPVEAWYGDIRFLPAQ